MKNIIGIMSKTIKKYNLIENGDKIAVGISGGKDSLALLKALILYKKIAKENFDLIAISIDQTNGINNYQEIDNFCKVSNIQFIIVKTEIFNIIFNIRKEKNPCSLCANLRRGNLNSYAKKYGCNKVALAHHSDDLIETFFLSLFFEGRLNTFKPKTYLSKMDLTVIRPLILIDEKSLSNFSKDLPVLKNICPVDHKTKREDVKKFLTDLENKKTGTKNLILKAITTPERFNLFDIFS